MAEIAGDLSMVVASAAEVYLDAIFTGRSSERALANVTAVIAVGAPRGLGSPEVELPATTWWQRDQSRRPVYELESVVRLRNGPDGWEIVEVEQVRTLLVGSR